MKTTMRNLGLPLACSLLLAGGCGKDNTPQTLSANNPTQAGAAKVVATGQTACYNTDGLEIACASTGQDGELRKGVALPQPRFTDNGDGTVTDLLTGLMWMQEANCIRNIHPTADAVGTFGDGFVSWEVGLNFAKDVNTGMYGCNVTTSYTDWRLPNRRELQSLFDYRFSAPAVTNTAGTAQASATDPFTGLTGAYFITSTSLAGSQSFFWYGSPYNGISDFATAQKTSFTGNVWLTRTATANAPAPPPATGQTLCYDNAGTPIACAGTGQDGDLRQGVAMPSPRFTDNSDGTVTDNLTGLVWLKEANCIGDRLPALDTDSTSGDGKVTWQHALDFIAGLNYGAHACGQTVNYTDWRLPNFLELESLINAGFTRPVLSNTAGDSVWTAGDPFLGVKSAYYWSSTSRNLVTSSPWTHVRAIEFASGLQDGPAGTNSSKILNCNYVWPVRGGN